MAYETIKTNIDEHIGVITLDRPQRLNAINRTLMAEVTDAVTSFNADPEVSVIVVHGNGRAFSAGFDMKESGERPTPDVRQWKEILEADFDFIMQFWDSEKPTIASVHGYCLAGAFELALACDVTIAAEGTKFGEPEARFGSGIIALLLPWIAGPKGAKELLLTGTDQVDARRALELGIVNRVVDEGRHLEEALAVAREISAAAPLSVRMTKRAINRSYDVMGLRTALLGALDTDILIESMGGPERAEFNRIRKEEGLGAALKWRDERFK